MSLAIINLKIGKCFVSFHFLIETKLSTKKLYKNGITYLIRGDFDVFNISGIKYAVTDKSVWLNEIWLHFDNY